MFAGFRFDRRKRISEVATKGSFVKPKDASDTLCHLKQVTLPRGIARAAVSREASGKWGGESSYEQRFPISVPSCVCSD